MPLIGMAGVAVMLMPMREAITTAVDLGYDAFELPVRFSSSRVY